MNVHVPERCARGFTLLELMLAIAILSIVMAMIAGSFRAVAQSKIHGEDRLETDRAGRAILRQMSNELRCAVQTLFVPSQVVLIGTGQMRGGVPVDALTVSTLDPGHRHSIVSFGTEDLVSYTTSPNPDHQKWFVLSRSQRSALLGQGDAAAAPPIVLADNLLGLHIRYYNGTQWFESWNSTMLPHGQQLPVAVSIDLELATANGHVMDLSTMIEVPMAVPLW